MSLKPTPPLKVLEMHYADSALTGQAREYQVISRPFAGRIGGSQHFTIESNTVEKEDILKRIPDAAPYLTWSETFDLKPFGESELWKQAWVEGYGQ